MDKENKNEYLSTMIIEIDISKTKKSSRQVLDLIQQLENAEFSDYDLEIKDIYFK